MGFARIRVGFLVCVRRFRTLEVMIGDGIDVDKRIVCELLEDGFVESLAFLYGCNVSSYVND